MRDYQREMRSLVERSVAIQAHDAERIAVRFVEFRRQALSLLPDVFPFNRAAIQAITASLARQTANLSHDVSKIVRVGMEEQADLAQDAAKLYADTFLGGYGALTPIGSTVRALDLASSFSADLIGLGSGGLGAEMLGQVNMILKLSALGADAGAYRTTADISAALGDARVWSARAERIYRTETLRIHSLVAEQSVRALDRIAPTDKRWTWSRISRPEHRAIDGQTVKAGARFRVPLREGGFVEMSHPRDAGAPASAVINCGCFVVPVPSAETLARAA